jgi:AraC-like DNA-binding protein
MDICAFLLYYPGMPIHPRVRGVRLHVAGGGLLDPHWIWEPAPFADFDLWLLRDGEAALFTAGGRQDLMRGDCLILPPGLAFRIEETRSRRTGVAARLLHTFVHFVFVDARGRPLALAEADHPRLHRRLRQLAFVEELLDRLLKARRAEAFSHAQEAETWLLAALHTISAEDDASALTGADRRHAEGIETLCQAIRTAPGKTYRVRDLARQLCCSPEHFTRLFRRFAGTSPGDFVVRARIDAARELLLDSSLSVGAIAEALGYCDAYFFSKQFRQKVGISPLRFRSRSSLPCRRVPLSPA